MGEGKDKHYGGHRTGDIQTKTSNVGKGGGLDEKNGNCKVRKINLLGHFSKAVFQHTSPLIAWGGGGVRTGYPVSVV